MMPFMTTSYIAADEALCKGRIAAV